MPSAVVQSSGSGSGRGRGHQHLRSAGQASEEPALQTDGLVRPRRDPGGEKRPQTLFINEEGSFFYYELIIMWSKM